MGVAERAPPPIGELGIVGSVGDPRKGFAATAGGTGSRYCSSADGSQRTAGVKSCGRNLPNRCIEVGGAVGLRASRLGARAALAIVFAGTEPSTLQAVGLTRLGDEMMAMPDLPGVLSRRRPDGKGCVEVGP